MDGGLEGPTHPHTTLPHPTLNPVLLRPSSHTTIGTPSFPLTVQGGGTALMMAAQNGHGDIADLLIKAGASLHVQNKVGGHGWWVLQAPATHPPRSRPSLVYPVPPLLLHTVIDPTSFAPLMPPCDTAWRHCAHGGRV